MYLELVKHTGKGHVVSPHKAIILELPPNMKCLLC